MTNDLRVDYRDERQAHFARRAQRLDDARLFVAPEGLAVDRVHGVAVGRRLGTHDDVDDTHGRQYTLVLGFTGRREFD